jgi:hypothetical protein
MKYEYEFDMTKTLTGLPVPSEWEYRQHFGPDGHIWERTVGQPLHVIETRAGQSDGRTWLHVSVSKRNGNIPSWQDLQDVRMVFVGEQRECYMVFPTQDRYVDIHNVLHLYCCLDAPHGVLPHFEGVVDGMRVI